MSSEPPVHRIMVNRTAIKSVISLDFLAVRNASIRNA